MLPDIFHPAVREWFDRTFAAPTPAQRQAWPVIARGDSTLLLAPTGNGKTLAAFLWCLNEVLFAPPPDAGARCRVLYVSPLKALAADIERNLRAPLAGIAEVARARDVPIWMPEIAVRTGDTPPRERARFARRAADILITTPESLFLLLTSSARTRLAAVDTAIVDEIHALLPGKRGAHLALSLERLEALRAGMPRETPSGGSRRARAPGTARRPLQRIGLSATQRPAAEAARFLGGAASDAPRATARGQAARRHDERQAPGAEPRVRPVTIIDASAPKRLELRVEVPIEQAARLQAREARGTAARRSRAAGATPQPPGALASMWAAIHPRLLELVRAHRSTLLFVNNRRLAERLADALNALAGEPLVRSHHGSLAPATRDEVERLLKAGEIRGLVTTSSLELGIDMGAIDLVVQVEAPPSVASGLQRIGRAGHQAGASSAGVIVPKFRGDLLACAACTRAMADGAVEATRYPRSPLDVLAQQLVATVAMETWRDEALFALVRGAAPFATLSRQAFDGVLDMLSGRYPSDAFAELRPRVTWDRVRGTVAAREGARQVVVANAGTIPDRGLYGVFLTGSGRPVRVGELDEEMVFEMRAGETFTLGASTWRVDDITHDRVLVSPAAGEAGRMPFWRGDQAGRSVELGAAIGALVRELRGMPRAAAEARLVRHHGLDSAAAGILLDYLAEQAAAGGLPDDRTLVVERCLDELGDWRICLLSPFGSRVHAPWAMAAAARIRQQTGLEPDLMWGDDGFVVRLPAADGPPDPALLLPAPDAVEGLVLRELGGTALFAGRFREAAARALLLPRRRPGARTPLWRQRRRAADLLAAIAPFGSFPIVLETHREILRDHFDIPALADLLAGVASRRLQVQTIDSRTPSPFAASLLFSYVASYIYDGDAPLAERRAQALSVDQAQLRELLGDAELRELIDPEALAALERQLQGLDDRQRARSRDGLHDLLIRLGDLSIDELRARSDLADFPEAVADLVQALRIVAIELAGESRVVAVEDAARYRDALGVPLPPGIPPALLEPVADAAGDILLRYARTHGPFEASGPASRYAVERGRLEPVLARLGAMGRLVEGAFRPQGTRPEWVDPGVLRALRRRSLARLRREIEPIEADAFARFLLGWHGIAAPRAGLEALLDATEQIQGAPVPVSVLERDVLPARVAAYHPSMLDTLVAAGEVVWTGVESLGARDGRVALYLTDHLPRLRQPVVRGAAPEGARPGSRAADVLVWLRAHGASFFAAIHAGTGGGFPQETVDALWELVWHGLVTNDTVHVLRAYQAEPHDAPRDPRGSGDPFRSRRLVPPAAQGRWSAMDLPSPPAAAAASPLSMRTGWAAALTQQLLARHGVVARETAAAEALPGGFSTVYPVLRAMEEAGRVRRGYFVAGLGGAQFALPGALDLLRDARERMEATGAIVLAAADPANPYGAVLSWPPRAGADRPLAGGGVAGTSRSAPPSRTAGALVVLVAGVAVAYLRRGERELVLFGGEADAQRTDAVRAAARALFARAARPPDGRLPGMLITEIDGAPAVRHPAAPLFAAEGFAVTALGLQVRTDRLHAAGDRTPPGDPPPERRGTHVAGSPGGGALMAQQDRDDDVHRPAGGSKETSERAGKDSAHNEGDDEAVRGGDTDPDRADAGIDRDDMLDDR